MTNEVKISNSVAASGRFCGTATLRAPVAHAPTGSVRQPILCPSCGRKSTGEPVELFHDMSLYACDSCDLHFWHPVTMPSASWYESAYQGRDKTAMPLEPGHRYFLSDPKAPKGGRLLDLGCGVGNFLAAAQDNGFEVTGVEFDRAAVAFGQQHYGIKRIFAMRPEEFYEAHPQQRFDAVTFFEVLEHQQDPDSFLKVAKNFLVPDGYVALSVPNRSRWQKGIDTLDYPPNHLTRWSPSALSALLERNGFEVVSLRAQSLGVLRAAQVLSMRFRTGLVSRVAGEQPPMLADLARMRSEDVQQRLTRLAEHRGHRLAEKLARLKNYLMIPMAALLLPFLRARGRTGLYLYSLARLKRPDTLSVENTNGTSQKDG